MQPRAHHPPPGGLSPALIALLLESFAFHDADRDGRVTFAELPALLRAAGFELSQAELHALTLRLTPRFLGALSRADVLDVAAALPARALCTEPLGDTLARLRGELAALGPSGAAILCGTGERLSAREFAAFSSVQAHSLRYGSAAPNLFYSP